MYVDIVYEVVTQDFWSHLA